MDDLFAINLNDTVIKGKLNDSDITVLFKIYYEDGRFVGKDICNNLRYELIRKDIYSNDYDKKSDFIYFSPTIYEKDENIYTYENDFDIATMNEIEFYKIKWDVINYVTENIDILLENDRVVTINPKLDIGKNKVNTKKNKFPFKLK